MYGNYSTRGLVERLIQHEAKPSAVFAPPSAVFAPPSAVLAPPSAVFAPPSVVFFLHTSLGGALTAMLYFLVIWLGVTFSSTQTAEIFGDQDISKCLTTLFLAVEQTNRINLASFSNLQHHARDQSCCLSV